MRGLINKLATKSLSVADKRQQQQLRHLNIPEYQGAELMSKYGISVPRGVAVSSVEEVLKAVQETFPNEKEFVIKSQLLAGGRRLGKFKSGLQGGVHIFKAAMVEETAGKMLGQTLVTKQTGPLGKVVSKVASSFNTSRGFSSSIQIPDSSEGAFPSDLLSKKSVLTPDRTVGLLQDLVIPVMNFQNEEKGFMVLAGDVFDVPIRKDIIHRVVRWQLAKRQQGEYSTGNPFNKNYKEVSGTGRKPWNQKGTGRARHGTLRGPQFRGGAVMHGPKPRSHAIKLNKKVRRLGLKIALSARAAEGKLLVFDNLELPTHKTKNIVNFVNQMEDSKKVLLVDGGPIDEKLKLATQNLHYVNVLPSIGLNVYSILLHDTLVMSRAAVDKIVERMHTPINR